MPLFSLFRTSSAAPLVPPAVRPAANGAVPTSHSYAVDQPARSPRMPPPRPPSGHYSPRLLARAVASVSSQVARLTGGRIGTLSVESALRYLAQGKDLTGWRIAGELPPASDHLSRQLSAYLNHMYAQSMRDGTWRCDSRLAQVLARYIRERLEGPDGPRFAAHFQPMIEQLAEIMETLPDGGKLPDRDDGPRVSADDVRRLLDEKREAPGNPWRARAERNKTQAEEQKRLNREGLQTLQQRVRAVHGRDVPVSRKELQSLVRVQRTFRARNKHISELFDAADREAGEQLQPPPEFVVTSYAANPKAPMANTAGNAINDRGMVNFHFRSGAAARQSGMPRTLSAFADQLSETPAGTIERVGGYNTIRAAPRDFLLRTSRADRKSNPGPMPPDMLGKLRENPVIAAPVQVVPARTRRSVQSPAISIVKNAGVDLGTNFDRGQERVEFQEFRSLSETLKEMHQQGLYHCDIKPGNMTRDGNGLHLIDFDGLVRPAVFMPSKVIMTRFFMAPNCVPRDYKENDEYAFLLSMAIVEIGSEAIGADSCAPVLSGFIDRHVKPEYREQLKAFVMDGRKGLGPDLQLHDVLMWS